MFYNEDGDTVVVQPSGLDMSKL